MNTEEQNQYKEEKDEGPLAFKHNLIDFVVEYLTQKPENTIDFAADYFELLKDVRDMQRERAKRTKEEADDDNIVILDGTDYSIVSVHGAVRSTHLKTTKSTSMRKRRKAKILQILAQDQKQELPAQPTVSKVAFLEDSATSLGNPR